MDTLLVPQWLFISLIYGSVYAFSQDCVLVFPCQHFVSLILRLQWMNHESETEIQTPALLYNTEKLLQWKEIPFSGDNLRYQFWTKSSLVTKTQ